MTSGDARAGRPFPPWLEGGSEAQRGFTLLELLIVMALLAMTMAVALPAFANYQRAERLRTGVQLLLAASSEARERAILRGQPVRLQWDRETNRYWLTERTQLLVRWGASEAIEMNPAQAFFLEMREQTSSPDEQARSFSVVWEYQAVASRLGREHELPPTVQIVRALAQREREEVGQATFYPDGQADGVLLVLENDVGRQLGIEIAEANGATRVVPQEELEDLLR